MKNKLFPGNDWSVLNKLPDWLTDLDLSDRHHPYTNLGIYQDQQGRYLAKGYVGVCRLKANGRRVLDKEGRECILRVVPRFPGLEPLAMLNELQDDDEFAQYLMPERALLKGSTEESKDILDNELFYFYPNEPLIPLAHEAMKDSSLLTVMLFLNGLKAVCRKPLMGSMQQHEENLTGKVKGKILVSPNIKHNAARARVERIYCRYQVYSMDILENRILKYALHKANRFLNRFFSHVSTDSLQKIRQAVHYCNKALEHVSLKNITEAELRSAKAAGFYAYYKPVLEAAKMVIKGISIRADGEVEDVGYITPYAINMQKLFEFYVRAVIKRELKKNPDWHISLEPYFKPHEIHRNENIYLMRNVRPDIVLKYMKLEGDQSEAKYIVFDVKYKRSDNKFSAREDTHQLLSYRMLFDAEHIGFLFPNCVESSQPTEIVSRQHTKTYYYQFKVSLEEKGCAKLCQFLGGIGSS
ncbi:5-methylcytosine restriction system specificity protein McrC [Paenibacillus thalictri]|uniref:Restriction endonuclease n=1 Tax=Paenibacillus thalictri TaxID=2527873 RepID=A0A4Q9DUZ5_9BACL|nr:hypothetical protein [Paenibacillus thalictri]TBL80847.1 hypothetical protein EYB31_06415 [Paenibacillus thalictri]